MRFLIDGSFLVSPEGTQRNATSIQSLIKSCCSRPALPNADALPTRMFRSDWFLVTGTIWGDVRKRGRGPVHGALQLAQRFPQRPSLHFVRGKGMAFRAPHHLAVCFRPTRLKQAARSSCLSFASVSCPCPCTPWSLQGKFAQHEFCWFRSPTAPRQQMKPTDVVQSTRVEGRSGPTPPDGF